MVREKEIFNKGEKKGSDGKRERERERERERTSM
jgi:hypothetical protein